MDPRAPRPRSRDRTGSRRTRTAPRGSPGRGSPFRARTRSPRRASRSGRGAARVLALVEGIRLDRAGALLLREGALAVEQDDVVGAGGPPALDRSLEVELLADVDEDGHDLVEAVPVLLEPADDAARVETAREGNHCNPSHLHSMQVIC